MSYTSMLRRGAVRLRVLACASVLLTVLACHPENTAGPIDEVAPPAGGDIPEVALLTSATAPGVPFGDFHLPTSMFSSSVYSGSLQAVWPSTLYSVLNSARNNAERIVVALAGNKRYFTNSDGTFNLSKWKTRISAYRNLNLAQYVKSGTLLGHYLVDEPFCKGCWGGRVISNSDIEAMARYSKSIWPSVPTGVRSPPTKLGSTPFSALDFAWAQWEGPLHNPSFGMSPQQFRDQQIAAAQRLRLGLVFGLNYLDAGDGSSRINGTYAKDPNLSDGVECPRSGACYRYQMSAKEVRNVGAVLAAASYGCAVLNWKYNSTFLGRSGMQDAIRYVASVARNRSRSGCNR